MQRWKNVGRRRETQKMGKIEISNVVGRAQVHHAALLPIYVVVVDHDHARRLLDRATCPDHPRGHVQDPWLEKKGIQEVDTYHVVLVYHLIERSIRMEKASWTETSSTRPMCHVTLLWLDATLYMTSAEMKGQCVLFDFFGQQLAQS